MMRRSLLILFLLTGCIVSAQEMPKPTGWVNDFAGVIPDGMEQRLSALCNELNLKTGAELALATVQSLEGSPVQVYANELFEQWGIGKKGEDNGVLILLAVSDRKIWIEVGYGLEPILPDGKVGRILDQYALPSLGQNDFGNGIAGAAAAVATTIADSAGVSLTGERPAQPRTNVRSKGLGIIPIIVFIILMIVTRGRILPWLLLLMMTGGGRGGGGGGFGGGGFGGGFGGFGGGASGGGGAGRSF